MEAQEAPEEPSAKRHKASIACDSCRAKKIKCDSVRPVCGACSRQKRKAINCTWSCDTRGIKPSRAQVLKLQERIHELEKIAVTSDNADRSHAVGPSETGAFDPRDAAVDQRGDTDGAVSGSMAMSSSIDAVKPSGVATHQRPRKPHFVSNSPSSNPPTAHTFASPVSEFNSLMNASASGMIGSLPGDPQSGEFFGESSAGSFINQVRTAVKQKLRQPSEGLQAQGTDVTTRHLGLKTHQTQPYTLDFVLPPRSKANQLLQIYWDIVYVLYPFVDKDETITKYRNLWTGESEHEEDHGFICLVNVIFALTSQLNGSIEASRREESARVFYQRAKDILDLWDNGSFQSVQIYLLLGQYFQSTNEPHQCWMMIGNAVRTAESLGLHLPETTNGIISTRKRELARKVWHGCIIMDRIVSMTYGRPPMVSAALAAAVPRPVAVDEERLPRADGTEVPLPDRPSILDFFINTISLYDILYEVLGRSYSSSSSLASGATAEAKTGCSRNSRSDFDESFSAIGMERRLVAWERRLPAHLKLNDPKEGDTSAEGHQFFARQAVILHQRYLHIRLLSLRTILSAYVALETSNGANTETDLFGDVLSQNVALQCATMCVTVAQEAIGLAHHRRPLNTNSVGPTAAWWYNVLFIYSAATVLVAARLCPSILSAIGEASISYSWSLAVEILRFYQPFNPVIEQLITALQLLFHVLPEHYQQFRETATTSLQHHHNPMFAAWPPNTLVTARSQPGSNTLRKDDYLRATNEMTSLGDAAMISDQALEDLDFDFVFDNNDLSWLNTLPFEL